MSNQSIIPQNNDLFKNADSYNNNNISMYVLKHKENKQEGMYYHCQLKNVM